MKIDRAEVEQPVSLMVPIYSLTELDLMGALDHVIWHFADLDEEAKGRAVAWLYARWGQRVRLVRVGEE